MKQAIVIATSPGREHWVKECLESIKSDVIVVSTGGYEIGKIKWVYENTALDRFIFLQDSIIVRDENLLLGLFDLPGSVCIMDEPRCFGSYLGLYERKTLDKIDFPDVKDKEESISQEVEWTGRYRALCEEFYHPTPPIEHKRVFTVLKHGRPNLLYINQFYEKWKGTWR